MRGGHGGAFHLMRDVVELQVKKHLEATPLQVVDHLGTQLVEKRHPDLEPGRMPVEHVRQIECAAHAAVERDDDAIAGGNLVVGAQH